MIALSVCCLHQALSVPTVPYFGSLPCTHSTVRGDYPYVAGGGSGRVSPRLDNGERYVVEGEIARGGHATVLRAHDRKLRRPVAIKQLANRRPRLEMRFMNEALITARLQHPSIVPIYDVGSWSDGTLYFAMQLVKGATLQALIRVVERAMARDPDARYRSATGLREDLTPACARRSGDRRSTSAG